MGDGDGVAMKLRRWKMLSSSFQFHGPPDRHAIVEG